MIKKLLIFALLFSASQSFAMEEDLKIKELSDRITVLESQLGKTLNSIRKILEQVEVDREAISLKYINPYRNIEFLPYVKEIDDAMLRGRDMVAKKYLEESERLEAALAPLRAELKQLKNLKLDAQTKEHINLIGQKYLTLDEETK